ncbi:hypothetical protein [Companilactobacillus zhachilii]|uniref:hypothetical protein n=1 Tax=Companilactobacillus zhachilii TaxID=2304606 RepID=UPI0040333FA4
MEIQVHMSNDETVIIKAATPISAYKQDNEFKNDYLKTGYLRQIFEGNLGSPEISTSEKAVGLAGLLAYADYFTINDVPSYYKTSSIVSIG